MHFSQRFSQLVSLCSLLLATTTLARAEEQWSRFRGPNGRGISHAKTIPTEFSEKDYNWKIELPGEGHSQPVVWKDKILVTSAPKDGSSRLVTCLSESDGKEVWTYEFKSGEYHNHSQSSFASGSPAVDATGIYVTFQDPKSAFIACLTHEGKLRWRESIGPFASQHGFGGSPMIYKDSVVFPCHQLAGDGESPSFVIALNKKDGSTKWKTPRKSRRTAYGTPCVYKGENGDELIMSSGSAGLYSLDAETGKPLWDADVFDKRTVASPVIEAGLVFGTCGSGGGGNYLVAVKPGGKGDVKETHVKYKHKSNVPYVPTILAKDGRLYLWADKGGIVQCLDAATGKMQWKGRAGGDVSGSPVWVDGRLFCITMRGDVVVVGTGDDFEVLARHSLGEMSRSTPTIGNGRMYLRTLKHLVSVGGKPQS